MPSPSRSVHVFRVLTQISLHREDNLRSTMYMPLSDSHDRTSWTGKSGPQSWPQPTDKRRVACCAAEMTALSTRSLLCWGIPRPQEIAFPEQVAVHSWASTLFDGAGNHRDQDNPAPPWDKLRPLKSYRLMRPF
ncbi:hypothetical protein M406DRAFT_103940 [Cryphonectria parasitica EP155]|uniref:Uncharacterized protein n=1 Tax=Cryphonectria parasitica (strain ATCC 38755 / EP155) TaxID=660469 RepID=A0A9P5CL24_CRYP1|nr:uncharacterized protein M406DRAFT_103940 [Cryphonectria parasitica EP155]KAF3761375.1 hypothetical protein M406DRAFT_103940 [Cryphonectria parasitica EP155]